jgi:hypothetical protein
MSADATAHVGHGEKLRVAPLSVSTGVRALFGVLMVIGVVTFSLEVSSDPTRAYAAWLHNYWVFLGLGLAGTFFSAIHYLVGATWSVVPRRIADAFSSFVPMALILYVVVAVGIPHLYLWSSPAAIQGAGASAIAKNGYLSANFVIRNSTRQDESKDPALTRKSLKMSAAFILTFAITFTLATFDTVMSLEPTWDSTIFGVYNWAGLWQAGLAGIAIMMVVLRRQGALGGVVSRAHYHDIGKLVFAFGVFWTYIGFSQFMLIWYANLPHETEWMIHRIYTGWGAIIIAVAALKFVIPFFVLMHQKMKENETVLIVVCAGVILGHWLDVYWMIYPAFSPEHAVLSWSEIGVALGFLGLFGWRVQSFLSRHPVAPHGDPDWVASVRFHG